MTPHPEVSELWARLENRDEGHDANALIDTSACEKISADARERFRKRIAEERAH